MQLANITMHRDRNATAKDVYVGSMALLVRSMFFTLQGEGPYAGKPALFLRLGGCNLGDKGPAGCAGCDTNFRIAESETLDFEDVEHDLMSLVPDTKHYHQQLHKMLLVVTGGEPSLHAELPAFLGYTDFKSVQIESNGHNLKLLHECQAQHGAYVVLSPKASLKGYAPALVPTMVEQSDDWGEELTIHGHEFVPELTCFKFVVSADPVNKHHVLPEWVMNPRRPPVDIYVSPCTEYLRSYEGEVSSAWDHTLVDAERTQANYAYAAKLAMEFNLRLSIQTHTLTAIP